MPKKSIVERSGDVKMTSADKIQEKNSVKENISKYFQKIEKPITVDNVLKGLSSSSTGKAVKDHPVAQKGKVVHNGKADVEPPYLGTHHPDFSYVAQFFTEEEQDNLIENLTKVDWQRVTYQKFGKERKTPRKTFCFGTPVPGKRVLVSWKGNQYLTEDMPEWLENIKKRAEEKTGVQFNACIMNNYENADHISWHQDDEKFLQHTTVASISLGNVRTFKVKRGPEKQVHEIKLQKGSLAVLYNGIEHSLPARGAKELSSSDPRYNITFRCLKTQDCGKTACGFGNYYMYGRGSAYQTNIQEKQDGIAQRKEKESSKE